MPEPEHIPDNQRASSLLRPLLWVLAILGAAYLPLFLGKIIFFRDIAHWGFPARAFLRDSLARGELPAWNPFQGLLWSQIILSIQLPLTVFPLIFLTSSRKVMGKYATPPRERFLLWIVATVIAILNIMLLVQILFG